MRMGPVFFLAALPVVARAQSDASLGLGVGTVRYSGGSTFSAASISPAAQLFSPSFFFGGGGTLSALPDGVWAAQGRADGWATVPSGKGGGPQLAASLSAGATSRSDGVSAASGHALGELIAPAGQSGVAFALGIVSGAIERQTGISSLRLRARAWSRVAARGGTDLGLSIEPTRLLGAWYTDVSASATMDRGWGPTILSAWLTARLSDTYGSKAAASAAVQYFVTPKLSLELGVGSYLAEPFQGLPRAGYVTAGLRFHSSARSLAPPPPVPVVPRLAPLIAARRGDSVVVRFHMEGARSVAIAGDWNAWQPVELRGLGGDIWEGAFVLAPGTYHFNLFVDRTEWVVPGGVATVPDGMGGLVAVLTVL